MGRYNRVRSIAVRTKNSLEEGFDSTTTEDVQNEMMHGRHSMWSVSGDAYYPCDESKKELPAGQYIPMYNEHKGVFVVKKDVDLDELIILPDSKSKYVLDAVESFCQKEEAFRNHGFLWKRGLLLWGPPGSGKTSCLQQVSLQIIEKGGISVYCNSPSITAEALRLIRRIEPKRQIVVMIEDIDALIERFGEPDLLALLDGELQIDNVVFVATTNYPEELDKRFINRPSRFDEVVYIGMPGASARKLYLEKKNPRLRENPQELDTWVKLTKGFSVAQLKECVVSVECLGGTIGATINRLKKMADVPSSQNRPDASTGIGFTTFVAEEID